MGLPNKLTLSIMYRASGANEDSIFMLCTTQEDPFSFPGTSLYSGTSGNALKIAKKNSKSNLVSVKAMVDSFSKNCS